MLKKILVVDDEQSMRDTLRIMLEKEGFDISDAVNGREAIERCTNETFDLVLTDLKMPELDGIEFVEKLTAMSDVPIIIMTAYATKEEAIRALNLGATFFIEKPFKKQELMNFINRSIKMKELIQENRKLKSNREKQFTLEMIIGSSPQISVIKSLIQKVGKTESNVLISGESGTGKEIVSRVLHSLSDRSDGPFVAINCGAIPQELLESELFGHIKGSFTGAIKDKTGLMELANTGTFFFDEIGNTSPSIQVKILRAIQEREVLPVGGQLARKVDIRIIAATNENLEEAIKRDEFRKDLYYRLNVINIHIPPLRGRREDIELLFMHFLGQKDASGSIHAQRSNKQLMKILFEYDWPGNIRELENTVERLVALSHQGKIDCAMLPEHIRHPKQGQLVSSTPKPIPSMEEIEKAYIHWILSECNGQKQKAAEMLGIGRTTLDRKIDKYRLK